MPNVFSVIVLTLTTLLLLIPYLPSNLVGWLVGIGYCGAGIILLNILATFIRKRKWRLAHLAASILSLPLIWAYVPIVSQDAKPNEQPLRLISWNVDNFLVSRDTMVICSKYMNSFKPDIICMQERPHETLVAWNDIKAAFPNHSHRIRNSREDEVLNLAIFSRQPIIDKGERMFKKSYNKYLWADVVTNADTLRIYNVHLQTTGIRSSFKSINEMEFINNASKRDMQAQQLYEDILSSPHPVVVCGDFNDTPCGYPARRLRMLLTDFSHRLPLCGTFKRLNNILKIDYMMCSPSIHPLNYQIEDTHWSDHKMQIGVVGIQK